MYSLRCGFGDPIQNHMSLFAISNSSDFVDVDLGNTPITTLYTAERAAEEALSVVEEAATFGEGAAVALAPFSELALPFIAGVAGVAGLVTGLYAGGKYIWSKLEGSKQVTTISPVHHTTTQARGLPYFGTLEDYTWLPEITRRSRRSRRRQR